MCGRKFAMLLYLHAYMLIFKKYTFISTRGKKIHLLYIHLSFLHTSHIHKS